MRGAAKGYIRFRLGSLQLALLLLHLQMVHIRDLHDECGREKADLCRLRHRSPCQK
jgi:hypothetical protein